MTDYLSMEALPGPYLKEALDKALAQFSDPKFGPVEVIWPPRKLEEFQGFKVVLNTRKYLPTPEAPLGAINAEVTVTIVTSATDAVVAYAVLDLYTLVVLTALTSTRTAWTETEIVTVDGRWGVEIPVTVTLTI